MVAVSIMIPGEGVPTAKLTVRMAATSLPLEESALLI
jgi:hypothetical protein